MTECNARPLGRYPSTCERHPDRYDLDGNAVEIDSPCESDPFGASWRDHGAVECDDVWPWRKRFGWLSTLYARPDLPCLAVEQWRARHDAKPLPWQIDDARRNATFVLRNGSTWADVGASDGGWFGWTVHVHDAREEGGTAYVFEEALAAADTAFRKLARESIAEREREIAELRAVIG